MLGNNSDIVVKNDKSLKFFQKTLINFHRNQVISMYKIYHKAIIFLIMNKMAVFDA